MATRSRPEVLAFRTTETEKLLAKLVAEEDGVTVSELLWRLVVPVLRDRLTETRES